MYEEYPILMIAQGIALTCIFHTKSITVCGKLIITALVSNCDLGSMRHTARHSNPSPALF
ncbi:MAG: hypothetical protein QE493_03665 [Verrucomicrobiae bacterium]|nr:hypothetical protein [Verrucomicrobiae bacterium]